MTTNEAEILDHGYVRFIEAWGSDERIIESARMSTDKGLLGWGEDPKYNKCNSCGVARHAAFGFDGEPYLTGNAGMVACAGNHDFATKPGDEKLLRFLWENKHATPFEMAGLTLEIQAPIFVFREWHRHRTQSYSELSARYTPMPDLHYVPSVDRLMVRGEGHLVNPKNKQAGTVAGAEEMTEANARQFRSDLMDANDAAQKVYAQALKWGVPKELARLPVPVNRYSRMRASANLRNWLGFLTLRMATGAQWEIRQYANAVAALVGESFPRTHALFIEGAA